MSTTLTIGDLRNMQTADLLREIRSHRMTLRKMRLGIHMKKEKDTAKYRREKRTLARMLTIFTALQSRSKTPSTALPTQSRSSTISAPQS
ncbi:50S ribosomal protein L29 [Candidatus Peregrinibacteria bacterium]|nr:50S ribosomal protein L29 [Candidatus Peregrinibacteria bacterium]MBI3815931.1 50S ribosomal protein L29 [Candidatus Peregrinibacteria bacterium]